MQTSFSLAQLADPDIQEADAILRACVHCGFCTATCPTYVLLGDELDSPRGRIYLIKDMLENDRPATPELVKHIDRCLSCLACMTTCPSGVHYMHLVDHGRRRIEETYDRPLADRLVRTLLATVLPRPGLFRLALVGAWLARPLARFLPARIAAMLRLTPARLSAPSPVDQPQVFPAEGERVKRVALLTGCAQQVLAPEINEATIRLLTRHGCEVVVAAGAGCCGALVHHLGEEAPALAFARANIDAWQAAIDDGGLAAKRISSLARDITELVAEIGLAPPVRETGLHVAYHSACSMQHGQRITSEPKALLAAAGFRVLDIPEGHLCCGSAGTYNILQPELATRLRDRKIANIESIAPDLIATGNIGCMTQLGAAAKLPIVHTVELLDWATGGKLPSALAGYAASSPAAAAT
jgi:glycolate oxidase iron-sulfur subunit